MLHRIDNTNTNARLKIFQLHIIANQSFKQCVIVFAMISKAKTHISLASHYVYCALFDTHLFNSVHWFYVSLSSSEKSWHLIRFTVTSLQSDFCKIILCDLTTNPDFPLICCISNDGNK